ncbi:MAG: energy-coupled thiamine transporter ThiT [Kurthia sp.]|nr:energy-coupled thiamine transporter ThiT [Candidatus Kurthia equi]
MNKQRLLMMIEVAVFAAIGFILDKISFSIWAQGGSISFVMVPIVLMAFRWGIVPGLATGLIIGVLQVLTGALILTPLQGILDYFFAFTIVGIAGIFRPLVIRASKHNKGKMLAWILIGTTLGGILRLLSHTAAGAIFFAQYAGDQNPWIYSVIYNCSYMIPAVILTAIVIYLLFRAAPKLFVQKARG